MTLGTAGDSPWTAPVYYVFHGRGFNFFSNPEARHIRDGENRICSASIYRDASTAECLQGVQMSGKMTVCGRSAQSMKTALVYAQKYGVGVDAENALGYFSKIFHADLYVFTPDEIFFMDNRNGFGSRERVRL